MCEQVARRGRKNYGQERGVKFLKKNLEWGKIFSAHFRGCKSIFWPFWGDKLNFLTV